MENKFESESVRHYISLLQENITRMAANCTSCKTWLITIVCALFALQFTGDAIKIHLWFAIIPTVLFFFMDAYYLGLEKRFRDIETSFIKRVKADGDYEDDMYSFQTADKKSIYYYWKGMASMSTWVFYTVILATDIVLSITL